MSDMRDVLPTLCRYINSLIDVSLVPDHLSLAKYNAPDKNGAEMLRETLRVLSYYAVRGKRSDIDFRNYDTLSSVKLHLAFLQYPAIEFYSLSQDSDQNRVSLIALAWLLGTQDVLAIALRTKLANSTLGAEYSHVDSPKSAPPDVRNGQPLSTNAQLDNILHLNGKVNLNLKEISDLIRERSRLTSKVHAASIEYLRLKCQSVPSFESLPHLSVSESALTKRVTTLDGESSVEDRRRLRELRNAGILLDAHAKWLDKRHMFFDWMATVMQEHRRFVEFNASRINSKELAAFISLLRHVISGKLRDLTADLSTVGISRNLASDCPSRAQKSRCNNAEAQNWLEELDERQNVEEENLQRNRKRLTAELKEMLRLIPSSIRV